MSEMKELKNFQTNLNSDRDAKQQYIDKQVDTEDESITDDSDVEEPIKIIARRKKAGKSGLDKMLLEQTINQQNLYLKAQRTISKLRTEIDIEEVKTRYLKLDMNNLQVKLDQQFDKNKEMKNEMFNVRAENFIFRVVVVLYIMWRILRLIM
jgi:hypothetical protein